MNLSCPRVAALVIMIFLVSTSSVFADKSLGSAVPSSGAGVFFDVFPLFELSNWEKSPPGHIVSARELAEFSERPAFMSAGFQFRGGPFSALMSIELHQDLLAFLEGASWSNLPKAPDSWSLMFGNNYPQFGYAGFEGEWYEVSAGRRKINIGPGANGLTISGENPYYDHVLAAFRLPLGTGHLGYAFATIDVPAQKRIFLHRISYSGGRFSFSLNEINLVVGDRLDFQDVGPFLVYHHLYQERSNVMLGAELRYAPLDRLMLYGETVMDDFPVGSELSDPGTNPPAMGFMAGFEWEILPGVRSTRPAMLREDHTLRLGAAEAGALSSGRRGGLRLRGESYLASTYLYRRRQATELNPHATFQTFTTHYFMQTNLTGTWPDIETFFAAPLAPDTWLSTLTLSFGIGRLEASAGAEYRVSGAESGIESKHYDPLNKKANWLGPQAPATRDFGLRIAASFSPDRRTLLVGSARLSLGDSGPRFAISAGAGFRIGAGVTPVR